MLFNLISGNLNFATALTQILAILVIVFLVLPFHEWAHAFTASKLGDTSIKYRGRLTLNPLAHVDPIGALALLLFGFGWAKPVPVDTRNFKRPKLYMGIVALMGPVANIVAAIAGGLIFQAIAKFAPAFFTGEGFGSYVYLFLSFYVQINVSLAVFNLLPIPPLDGSKILFVFLPDKAVAWFYRYQQIISIILLALLWVGVLRIPLSFLSGYVMKFVNWITALPFSFF
ncbi:site-2 protease family protein [Ruminococcus sp.]|uniref:site-2 protease family protein n=1 Tax=Ruminococcus sp. TaxID=41978 RepID=UPI00292F0F70|nr:site-2 protease family protein [uncultured Ruminococcus sp.]